MPKMTPWGQDQEMSRLSGSCVAGPPLTLDEARKVMNIAPRIAAIVLLAPALNANYQAVKEAAYS
jgi:hypothetical protein